MTTTPHAELLTAAEVDALFDGLNAPAAQTGSPRQMFEVIVRAAERALLARLGEQRPAAWRYTDARGHYRYRGPRPGFDKEYAILKPAPLYAHPPAAQPVARIAGVDEYGPRLEWFKHWTEFADGTNLYTIPTRQHDVRLADDSNPAAPGQRRPVAGPLEMGQQMGGGAQQDCGDQQPKAAVDVAAQPVAQGERDDDEQDLTHALAECRKAVFDVLGEEAAWSLRSFPCAMSFPDEVPNVVRQALEWQAARSAAQGAAQVPQAEDSQLLDFLGSESLDLRRFSLGDDDVGWRTVQHHQGRPAERVASEVYRDDPRQAIREAMARLQRDPYCTGPLHEADAAPHGEGER